MSNVHYAGALPKGRGGCLSDIFKHSRTLSMFLGGGGVEILIFIIFRGCQKNECYSVMKKLWILLKFQIFV